MSIRSESSRPAVFVAYGGGHVNALLPVALKMQALGFAVQFLALTTAALAVRKAGLPCVGFADLPGARDEAVQALGQACAEGYSKGGPVAWEETIAYLGLNMRDLQLQWGEKRASELYAQQGRAGFYPLTVLKQWLGHLNPCVVVTTNSPRAERAAVDAARQLGIPSLCLVDLFAKQEIEWIGRPGFADKVCVLNEAVKKDFLVAGRRADELVVTGNPAFDPLFDPQWTERAHSYRTSLGVGSHEVLLLWASQPEPAVHPFKPQIKGDPELPVRIEQAVRTWVASRPGVHGLVRYHPSQSVGFMPQARMHWSKPVEPVELALHACDAVVVMSSTVGLQAWLVGKPVFSVDCSMFSPDVEYAALGVSRGVLAPEQLPAALSLWARQQGEDACKTGNSATNLQGQARVSATERVLTEIISLIEYKAS